MKEYINYSRGIVVVYLILLLVELFKELQKVKWAQVYGTIFISLTNKCYCQGQKMDLIKLFFFHKDKSASTQ